MSIPHMVPNWIGGVEQPAILGKLFDKISPTDGRVLSRCAASTAQDVDAALCAAEAAQPAWGALPAVRRGMILHEVVLGMRSRRDELAEMVALETGKSRKEALGEVDGAAALGLFYASEGQRLYGKTCTSAVDGRTTLMLRQPVGVAGLIIAANTPIANVAWKVFPALVCGNAAVLKAAEDTPGTAWLFGHIAHQTGLPAGVLSIVQGTGLEAGAPLVADARVGVVSFTGSTAVGRSISEVCAGRLAKVSLELGGKNPFVVCDDADLERAVSFAVLSAFSNAGQRCASASRFIVFDSVYEEFRSRFVERTRDLKVGTADNDDLGPVINERQLHSMLATVDEARLMGAVVLEGGHRMTGPAHAQGFYVAPTILEDVDPQWTISRKELFGPIACLYRAPGFEAALALANDSPYGLTACIHTRDMNRAIRFMHAMQAGVVSINGATYGSEPHMPFGGFKDSGNGTREPGTEAINIYSELKNVFIHADPTQV
ncbi:aldehyde dehydrogenase (NAD+) [Humidesulfovibrio mexicanus]|uniref:Aldehyde dehydrogenase (NAD+) n=1 Tax=Humidesulfovibrio mexicanus TaxID=147047 RepID=A0A238Y708_9BACT|nr:aldehyde dehydrogenase family protein [Humidesulfovibrio mexicanus]SNR66800.1 aldehyde dehydrogenase (NAD+) [Humidesulfovibrio mexicanus]